MVINIFNICDEYCYENNNILRQSRTLNCHLESLFYIKYDRNCQ